MANPALSSAMFGNYLSGSQPGGQMGGGTEGGMGNFLSSLLFGQGGQENQFSKVTPEQKSILDQLLQQGGENTNFQGIEDTARQQFQQQTIPSLAERFTSMGDGQTSSAFQNALGQSGAGLESQLAGLKSQFGLQQLGMGMQPQFESTYNPAQPGLLQGGMGALAQLLPLLMLKNVK